VDADPAARELAARWLAPLGPFHAIADPEAGLAVLRERRPALLVVDLAAGGPALELLDAALRDPDLDGVAVLATCPAVLPDSRTRELRSAAAVMSRRAGHAREAILATLSRPPGAAGEVADPRIAAGLCGR
jgi:CheY-like chemotaxis protein